MTSGIGAIAVPVSVNPGEPTLVLSRMPQGTMLINLDSVNAVWVSDNPSVAPNYGFRIGPNGNLTWSRADAPCYAAVDTGVVSAVNLSVGDAISDIANPQDIAVATATQLLAKGIPSVYQESVIATNVTISLTNDSRGYDVSKYASVTIHWSCSNPVGGNGMAIFFADSGGNFVFQDVIMIGDTDATSNSVRVNVKGPTLYIINQCWNPTNSSITFSLVGNNRTQPRDIMNDWYASEVMYYNKTNFTSVTGTTYTLTNQGRATQHLEGPCFGTFRVQGANITGIIQLAYWDKTGQKLSMDLTDTSDMVLQASITNQYACYKKVSLPKGGNQFQFFCTFGTTGTSVFVWLVSDR